MKRTDLYLELQGLADSLDNSITAEQAVDVLSELVEQIKRDGFWAED